MEVIREKIDKEFFIDIVLSEKEIDELLDGKMVSTEFYIGEASVSVGIRQTMPGEENAT